MASKQRKSLDKMIERYAANLLYEATNGSIGAKPRTPRNVVQRGENEQAPTLQEKRALLDSLIKLQGLNEKYRDDDDSGSGLADMRRRLNGGGETGAGRTSAETEAGSESADVSDTE